MDIDLSKLRAEQGFRIIGENESDESGYVVSSAGDVNNDGYGDVIIGTPQAISGAGKSYVIFGKASGFHDINLSALTTVQGFRIIGEKSGDLSGNRVSSAGDVNGDGYADVIIGAPSSKGSGSGKSYVIFGKASGFSDIELSKLTIDQGFRILGESSDVQCCFSVSGAGDVNKDGYADIIIGAYNAPDSVGKSYVIFGKSSGLSDIELSKLTTDQGFRILSTRYFMYENKGHLVSSAGDVNGDGYADIVISSVVMSDWSGYVIFGKANGFVDVDLRELSMPTGFKILGGSFYNGRSVSSAGDVNKDGYAEIIIGLTDDNAPSIDQFGEIYVIFGKANGFADIKLSTLTPTQGFKISYGGEYQEVVGISVSGAGDVNKDGFDEIIVGAPCPDSEFCYSGVTKGYVIFGKAGGFYDIEVSKLTSIQGYRIIGESMSDRCGWSVGSAGDFNNDGYGDVIIGAYKADDGSLHALGKSYVIFGGIQLDVKANNAITTYGSKATFTLSYNGFIDSDKPANLTVQPKAFTATNITTAPGDYPIKVAGGVSNKYRFFYEEGVLTIKKALLEVTANNATTTQGVMPPFTLTYKGFVNSENPSNLIVEPISKSAATAASKPGIYDIIPSDGKSNNYEFTYKKGYITVHEAIDSSKSNSLDYFIKIGIPILGVLGVGSIGFLVYNRCKSKQEHKVIKALGAETLTTTLLSAAGGAGQANAEPIDEKSGSEVFYNIYEKNSHEEMMESQSSEGVSSFSEF